MTFFVTLFFSVANNLNARIMNFFLFDRGGQDKTLIIGDAHDSLSINQFKICFKNIEFDEFLIELPQDINPEIIKNIQNSTLATYLAYNFPEKSRYIDIALSADIFNLGFSLQSLFTESVITKQDIEKTTILLKSLGDEKLITQEAYEDFFIRQLYNYKCDIENNQEYAFGRAARFLQQVINDRGLDFLNIELSTTVTAIIQRNKYMASRILEKREENKKLCIIGNGHINEIRELLLETAPPEQVGNIEPFNRKTIFSILPKL